MKNLDKLNVVELNTNELKKIDGGIMFTVCVILFAVGVIIGSQLGTNGGPQPRR